MTTKTVLLATSLMVAPVLAAAQGVGTSPGTPTVVPGPAVNVAGQQGGLDPKDLYKPLQDSWPERLTKSGFTILCSVPRRLLRSRAATRRRS